LSITKIPHDQTWVWTRAAAVGSRRLTAWAMAQPQRDHWPFLLWTSLWDIFCTILSFFIFLIKHSITYTICNFPDTFFDTSCITIGSPLMFVWIRGLERFIWSSTDNVSVFMWT
jgi:hypothetical protein